MPPCASSRCASMAATCRRRASSRPRSPRRSARSTTSCATHSVAAHDNIRRYHEAQRDRPARYRRQRAHDRRLDGPGRPGRLLRPRGPGHLSLDGVDDRGARAGRGRLAGRAVRTSRRGRIGPDRDPRRGRHRRRRRGLRRRRRAGDRGDGLRHRHDCAGRRHRRARATSTSRSPSARSPASSPCRRRSPARARSWSSPTTRPIPTSPPSTSSCRPSTVPTAWRGSSRRASRQPTPSTRPSRRAVAAAPRRAEIEATLRDGGYVVLVESLERAVEVANAVAPEHLQLMCADPAALLPLVRHAGAIFCGPWSPAAMGDYAAGPSHVLPTNSTARFSSVLSLRDFQKEMHSITFDRSSFAALAPHVIAMADAEGLDAHAQSIRLRLDGAGGGDPTDARADPKCAPTSRSWRATTRRRSRSTCGSTRTSRPSRRRPSSPRCWPTRSHASNGTAIPIAPRANCGAHWPSTTASRPSRCSRPTARTKCCSTRLLAYGGPGRRAAVFEPTYALHSHIARLAGTEVVEGERGHDFALDLDEVRRVVDTHRPEIVFLCSPNNPTAMVDPPEVVQTVLDLVAPYGGLVIVDEAYGQFAPSSAVSMIDDDVPLVVTRTFSKTWSMAAARLGYLIGPTWVVDQLDKVALPYHLDVVKQIAGTLALRFDAQMQARVASLVEERGGSRPRCATCPSRCGRRGRTSSCSGRPAKTVPRCGTRCSSSRCWCATARRGPASTAACGSRSAPGTEDDRFLAALKEILT